VRRREFVATLLGAPFAAPLAASIAASVAASDAHTAPRAERVEYPEVRPRVLEFPRDHGAHPEYRIEWWYITGWLRTARGEEVGVQVTFFRARSQWRSDNPSALAPRQFVFAHAALADATVGRLRHDQRGGRTGLGLAGAEEGTTRVWIDDWHLALAGARYEAVVNGRDFGYRLAFTATGAPLLQGEAGYSRKGAAAGEASHYYSRPHLAVTGEIERDGRREAVTGTAWLDHEWSSQYMAGDAVGWDWAGVNLDGGGALMAFVMRAKDGTPRWGGATLMAADRTVRTFAPSEVAFTPLRTWTSARTGVAYPVVMRVAVGDRIFDLAPLMDDQELDSRSSTGTIYWEGAVRAAENGRPVGRGYLELTGYWKPQRV
jgi:predicted secreted hydrolase